MSTLTGLISAGGGGGSLPNDIARKNTDETLYTDVSGGVWLKTGNLIDEDLVNYPDANSVDLYLQNAGQYNDYNEATSFSAMRFSNDGSILVTYYAGWIFEQLILSTPYDITSGTKQQTSTFSSYTTSGTGLSFYSNGSYLFLYGHAEALMFRFSLSSPYSTSSITAPSSITYNYSSYTASYIGVSSDGTKAYFLNQGDIDSFDLTTPYDLFSRNLSSKTTFDISSVANTIVTNNFMAISSNRFIGYSNSEGVYKHYVMETPNDISTIKYIEDINLPFSSGSPHALTLSQNDQYLHVVYNNDLYRYDLSTKIGVKNDTGIYDYVKIK